jgi:ribonuclease PH
MARAEGRRPDDLRSVEIIPGFTELHPASCLIKMGRTWVLCAASVEERVPSFLDGKGQGWVTAEYGMLPASGNRRTPRERQAGGRSQEISRLIGRSLRAAVDMSKLGQRTITVDCDVIQADGGTRTAAVTGGYVALALAIRALLAGKRLAADPLKGEVAAVSAGVVGGELLLDLDYSEDVTAETDLNVVMNGSGELIEVQGTAEGQPFAEAVLHRLLEMSREGIRQLVEAQRRALAAPARERNHDDTKDTKGHEEGTVTE